jgi:hypothetical protein
MKRLPVALLWSDEQNTEMEGDVTTPSLRAKRSNPKLAQENWIASSLRSSQ